MSLICKTLTLESMQNVLDPEGTDGVASYGILWSGEDGVDQPGGLPQVLPLLYRAHRL